MNSRVAIVILVGLLAALLVVGCGADKERAETETTETSREPAAAEQEQPAATGPVRVTPVNDPARRAYVTKVDAICRRLDPERSGSQEKVGNATDTAGAVRAYDDSITLGWRELRSIEAVSPPPGDAAVLRANVLDPVRAQLELRKRISEALAEADVPLLRRLRSELDKSAEALTGFARGYGFRDCGEA